MSESAYKNNLSQYLDLYFKFKEQGNVPNQIAALNQIIILLQTLVNLVPYQERGEYTKQLEHSIKVRNDLIQSQQLLNQGTSSSIYQSGRSTSSASQILEPQFSTSNSIYSSNRSTTGSEKKQESFIDRKLTLKEKDILRSSSYFNGSECIVWLERDATDFDQTPYVDPFDYLLSKEQITKGYHFEYPTSIFSSPDVVKWPLNPFNIRQQKIGDCTIISSIISCANYEVRFKKPLATGIIYPQVNGRPVYNPFGKYYVKLWFNGIPRRVLVDHRVLVTQNRTPVSTYSKKDGELWSILIEKAFLKVHGGYSYNGGNGGQDTYSITGWIPENLSTKDETLEKNMETWNRVSRAFNCGDCIVTAGTFNTLPPEGLQNGLTEGHCYCICRMETIDGKCLLQIRNPWGCNSWKGPYAYSDTTRWTPQLRSLCPDYEYRLNNPQYDDGLFWMEFTDFLKYFGGFNVNWSTSLLSESITYHDRYNNFVNGLLKDTRDMSDCPQYAVEVNNTDSTSCPVYIMLSRHYIYYDDLFGTQKRKFLINLQAYKTKKSLYVVKKTDEMEEIEEEVLFTNIPYSLVKIRVPPGRHFYTIIVLTMKENEANLNPFNFSISMRYPKIVQATMIPMFSVPDYHFMTRVAGCWTEQNAGCRPSQSTYLKNPMYAFTVTTPTVVHAHLQTGTDTQAVNLRLMRKEDYDKKNVSRNSMVTDSGAFMANVCGMEASLSPGTYCIIPSAFDAGYKGDYTLTVRSSHPVDLKEFQTVYRPVPGTGSIMANSYSLIAFVHAGSTGQSVFDKLGFNNCLYCRVCVKEMTQVTMKMTASLGCRPMIAVFTSNNGQRPAGMHEQHALHLSDKKETTSVTSLVCTLKTGYYFICYGLANTENGDVQLKIFASKPLQFFYSV